MTSSFRKALAVFCLSALAILAAQNRPAAPKPAPVKPGFDKAAFEKYIRHLFVWGPQYQLNITEPKPSPELPGYDDVKVRVVFGTYSEDAPFYVSRDGQKIVRAMVFDLKQNPFKTELDKLKTQFQPSFGTPGAPVVLVLFSDFQCPYCREEAKMLRRDLLSAYPKDVRVYFKDYPLSQIHAWSKPASMAGRCVFRQNAAAFWQYHDWIFEHQQEITADNLKAKILEWAKGVPDLDAVQLASCMESKATEAEVDKNIEEGKSLQVTQLPTMFVNGRRLMGQLSWTQLRNIIDYEIEYQKTAKNAGEDCGCEVKIPSALSGLTK
jgi:protein-disulfide isomerase